MERDHGPLAEGAASFHTTRWTIVMRATQNQTLGGQSALAQLCRNYGIHSTCSLDAEDTPRMTPRTLHKILPCACCNNGRSRVLLDYPHLRSWLLPSVDACLFANAGHHRPDENPGQDVPYTQNTFDDRTWRHVDLPHDWAIQGPFIQDLPAFHG